MEENVLQSIKKLLGLNEDFDAFDQDILIHINTVIGILYQLGVRGKKISAMADETLTWCELLDGNVNLAMVRSYMYLKVRLLFDPPGSTALIESINRAIAELEWRIIAFTDYETKE